MSENKAPVVVYLDIDGVLNVLPYEYNYLKSVYFEWEEDAPYLSDAPYTHTAFGVPVPPPVYDYVDTNRISMFFSPAAHVPELHYPVDTVKIIEKPNLFKTGNVKLQLSYSQELMGALSALEKTGKVEIIWLTTWAEDAHIAAAAFGIGQKSTYVELQPPGFRERNYNQEKTRMVERIVDPYGPVGKYRPDEYFKKSNGFIGPDDRPMIWVDDIATSECDMTPRYRTRKEYQMPATGYRASAMKRYFPGLTRKYREDGSVLAIKTDERFGLTRRDMEAIKDFAERFSV